MFFIYFKLETTRTLKSKRTNNLILYMVSTKVIFCNFL